MKRTLTLAVLVAFLVPAFVFAAMAPGSRPDPGNPDKVYFGEPSFPADNKVVVAINVKNDEPVTALDIPLKYGNPDEGVILEKVDFEFPDNRVGNFQFKFSKINDKAKTVLIGLVSSAMSLEEDMQPGSGPVAYLHFTVTDDRMTEFTLDLDNSKAPSHTLTLIENRVVGENGRDVIDFKPGFTPTPIKLDRAGSGATLPKEYSLRGNYPNPFNAKTVISFALPKESRVSLDIYNILGQKVKTLVNGMMPAGYQKIEWDGTDHNGLGVSSGVYLYKLKADEFSRVNRMTLLK
ncbi:MAG: T9SS type A sorting domain-containing protein [candidate division Zixibacteria bacterium]|nr:T9SS type A sorting domain-containing protein [candidate division Zixibacteria bacterium]